MKTVMLAGGRGRRLGGAPSSPPKALAVIGGTPVIRHVMDIYGGQGFGDFLVAVGHRGEEIRRHFADPAAAAPWKVRVVPTGAGSGTADRIARLRRRLRGEPVFMATYCDGLADVDLRALLDFHRSHGRVATVTAVRPPARFGRLTLEGARVAAFEEKPEDGDEWINGGFFALNAAVFEYLDGGAFEGRPLERLAAAGELMAWRHAGFWRCMDTPCDREVLEELCASGSPPWRRRTEG